MYDNDYYSRPTQATASLVNSTMKRVYVKMTLGLIVTALTAWIASSSAAYINFLIGHQWFMWVLMIAWFGLGIAINGAINRISTATATSLFYLFALLNGLMFCTIFLAYSPTAITKTFLITAGTFGAMSVYGYFTPNDLTKVGSFLIMALFGLIIASVVNIFVRSSGLDWIISIVGVLIFIGLTAWDTQQVKRMAELAPAEAAGKLSTLGALSLYLDFVNLFLYLLRIFGGSNND